MTGIEYLDETWNFIGGCSPIATGCKNCWACRTASGRLKNRPLYKGLVKDGKWTGEIRLCTDIGRADLLEQPLHWREPRRIGVQFMGDLFHEKVPFEFIDKVMAIIALCPQHTFQVLTKRIERALEYMREVTSKKRKICDAAAYKIGLNSVVGICVAKCLSDNNCILPNLWLGVSISTQEDLWMADVLTQIPAVVRFISFEPLLEDIA